MPSRTRPGASTRRWLWIAATLAIGVHVLFVLVLVFSVNWQNRRGEPVTAELYAPPAPAKSVTPPSPQPKPPPPEPQPPPKAEPPKVEPKPPPKVEQPKPSPSKADIALKAKQEDDRKKQEQADRKEKERKESEKRDAEKKRLDALRAADAQRAADARARQDREAEALKAQADRERQAQERAATDAARARADADYIRRVQAKIKGMVALPPDIAGNPEVIFDIVQLPTGEIIDVKLRKSSGTRAYDEAMERAILKSSPLPRPDSPDLFRRNLTLKFRPLE